MNNLVFVQFNSKLINKHKRLIDKELNINVLLTSDGDTTNTQCWIVDDGDEEVESSLGLTRQMVDKATEVDEMT